jgi:parallel beta-helix repeat protein
MRIATFTIGLALLLFYSCQESEVSTDQEFYEKLQLQLINAEPGAVIEIPAGTFYLDRPLSLDGVSNVTIRGAGMDRSILSFKNQKAGAEGLRITADSVTIEDLTVMDTKGDAIKAQDCNTITFRRINTSWSDGAKASNGGYGLYPVSSQNVLIDSCLASYASDAGIYVGQCTGVTVRNCLAYENVAGIEIENCTNAVVHDNISRGNTGGILVFDLPGLPAGNGYNCKIYNNLIEENNHKNFAPEGNIVGIVPPGTGIILLAAKGVEIYQNQIIGHKTIGLAIASYHITEMDWEDGQYNPYTYDVYIHQNRFERKRALPDLSKDFGKLVNYLFPGKPQDIIYDGILDSQREGQENPMNICIQQEAEGLRFAQVDAAHDFENVRQDVGDYDCSIDAFIPVQ